MTVHETRSRLLPERLEEALVRAQRPQADEEFDRLARLALALLDRHPVDRRGRCKCCRGQWRRRCTVLPLIGWYLEQPNRIVAEMSEAGGC